MISLSFVGPVTMAIYSPSVCVLGVMSFATTGMPRLETALTVLQDAKGQLDWKALSWGHRVSKSSKPG